MSVHAMALVWADRTITCRAELLVMLAIADHADGETFEAWPSIDSLAQKARLSQRGVQRVISELFFRKKLDVKYGQGPKGTNVYRVIKGGVTLCHPADTGTESTPETVPVSAPESSGTVRNHQKPSLNKNKRAFRKPSLAELLEYGKTVGFLRDQCERFLDYYESKGWLISKSPMKDWKATVRNWIRMKAEREKAATNITPFPTGDLSVEEQDRKDLNEAIYKGTFWSKPLLEQQRLRRAASRDGTPIPFRPTATQPAV